MTAMQAPAAGDSGSPLARLIRDGARGSFRQADPALDRIRTSIVEAAASGQRLLIAGSGSKAFYGEPGEPGEGLLALPVSDYRGIVSYEPTELVVTARCGTPLAELEAAVQEQGQMLAFDPPRFGGRGTVGGAIATGLSGPRRASLGSARDFVLGAALLDAQGQWLQFGGTVMKNVAGYDLARLLCGSMGVFGVIAEVSLKVLPRPAAECTLMLSLPQQQALDSLNAWGGQPLPLVASHWHQERLHLRLSGAAAAVERAARQFESAQGAVVLDAAQAAGCWAAWRDQSDAFFERARSTASQGQRLWRVSLPSTAAALEGPGETVIEWGGALRWLWTDAGAGELRAQAERLGGTAMLYHGQLREQERASGQGSRFHPLSAPVQGFHQRLKAELDPRGLFNPSRMYPGL